MKKLLILFLLCMPLFSCGKKGYDVYLFNFKPEANDAFVKIAEEYQKETGIKMIVSSAASGVYEESLRSELLKRNYPTIFTINGYVGLENFREYCMDLGKTEAYELLNDNGKSLAIKEEDKVYGIPVSVEGYGLIYNKKLFDAYLSLENRETDFDMINSYQDLIDIVDDLNQYINGLKKCDNEDIKKLKGVFSTSLKSGSQWPYQSHLSSIPLFYEFKEHSDNEIAYGLEAKEINFAYFDDFMNIFDLYINNSVVGRKNLNEVDYDQAVLEFAKGQSFFIQQGNWAYSNISKAGLTDVGMIPVYLGIDDEYTIPVGTENFWAINSLCTEKQKEESLRFIKWLFDSEKGKKLVNESLGFIAPFKGFDDIKLSNPLSQYVFDQMNGERPVIPWVFQSYPSDVFKDIFGSALVNYSKELIDKNEVLRIVKDKWRLERKNEKNV